MNTAAHMTIATPAATGVLAPWVAADTACAWDAFASFLTHKAARITCARRRVLEQVFLRRDHCS